VLSVFPRYNDPIGLQSVSKSYSLPSIPGKLIDAHVTRNSMHMFLTVSRYKFEVDSIPQQYEVCSYLDKDPENTFLKSFLDFCNRFRTNIRSMGLDQFGVFVTSCNEDSYCPGLDRTLVMTSVAGRDDFPDGKLVTVNSIEDCPKGTHNCLLFTL
jgi:hypothetical protein